MTASLYRASSMQRQFYLLWQLVPAGSAYNVPSLFHLRGDLSTVALARAVADLAKRHPVLRTTFEGKDGQVWARIHGELPPKIDLLGTPVDETDQAIRGSFESPFDLEQGPLFRAVIAPARPSGHWLALTFHHVAMDLRSKALIAEDLAAIYSRHAQGTPLPTIPATDYATIAAEEASVLEQAIATGGLDYFAEHLADPPAPLALPMDRPRGKTQPTAGSLHALSFDLGLSARLQARATALRTKPFLLLLGAWAVLLARAGATSKVAVSVPFTNRRQESWKDVVGCFVNNLPLVVEVGALSFDKIVAQIRRAMLTHHRNQEIPMARILERIHPPRDPSRNPIFQAGFTFEPPMSLSLPGVEIESKKVHANGSQLDVFMNLWETHEGFAGHIEYATQLFDKDTMARLGSDYLALLDQALVHGDVAATKLDMLDPTEKELVLRGFNQTEVDFHAPAGLHDLFLAQVDRSPRAIALSMGGRAITYAQLKAQALSLASRLCESGLAPGDLVGVYMHRSVELPVALLAILFTGAAYVPIDPEYPAARVRDMIADAKMKRVLAHAATLETWPGDRSILIDVNAIAPGLAPASLPRNVQPTDHAYVIFTSGSTGRPKGAANTHAGIVNRILWMQAEYQLGQDDVVLQKTPYGFDVSTWEFFWPIVVGARLEMAPPGIHRDPLALARLIQAAGITTIHFVPSMLQAFLDHPESRNCVGLRRVIASGEALPAELVGRCQRVLSAPLYNLYGPTEAAVDVTAWDCRQKPDRDPVPIGKPIANTRMYVLDPHHNPVPIGVPGELYIGGIQVGTGYVGRPELTAERFVPDPFSPKPAARLYRTGDLARWDPDGQLVFLGRLDHQVKIRGLRIELSEIESVLDRFPGVRQSVVVAHPPGDPNARIVAYAAADPGPTFVDDLRAHAAETLPAYMVPSQFLVLPALPLSPNGKVDRKALPEPRPGAAQEPSPPEGEIEAWLVEEWKKLLSGTPIGRDGNVFDLGGNSVMIASLSGRVKERFGVDIPLVRFFEFPTVAGLAAHLSTSRGNGGKTSSGALDAAQERALKRRATQPRRPRG